MSERPMTSDEAADALERWAVPQLAKRRRPRRTLGNNGQSPIAIPEDLDTNPPGDLQPSDRAASERPPVVQTDTSDEAVRDARSLIVMLEARVAEMSGELKEARADLRQAQAVITDLTRKAAARAEGLDALLAVERERMADLRADMDRWRSQVEQLAAITPEPKSSRSWWPWRRSA